ncbi:hypothetical protein D3C71_1359090 [compost metagenome]
MCAITTNFIFIVQYSRNSVHISFFRHGLVECSIEYNNLRYTWHIYFRSRNPHHCCWVMQWCKVKQLTNFRFCVSIHKCGGFEELATMHYAVTYSINFFNRFNYTMLFVCKTSKDFADRSIMFQNFAYFCHFRFPSRFMIQNGGIHSNTFNQTFSQNRFIGHVIQLIFQRRTT